MRVTHTAAGPGSAGAEARAAGDAALSGLPSCGRGPFKRPRPLPPALPASFLREARPAGPGGWAGVQAAPPPVGRACAASCRSGPEPRRGRRERAASGGGAARGGAGRRAPEGERAGGHGRFRASPGGGRLAGRAEPSRGLAGAGPGSRGRRRPGPPPAPPTLAQRAAAASPLRMSRKGPRAEVCADCSAPGKRGLAGGGTAQRGRRAGAGAWRERRAGPEGGAGLGAAASGLGPRPGHCGAASLAGGPAGGPRFPRVRGRARKDIPGATSHPSV